VLSPSPRRNTQEGDERVPPDLESPDTQNHEGSIWDRKWFFRVMPEKNHIWFHEEPFKLGFFKEPFPLRVLQRTNKGVLSNLQKKVL